MMVGCVPEAERKTVSPWPPVDRERLSIPVTPAPEPDDFLERDPALWPPAECATLDNTTRSWYYRPTGAGQVPSIPSEVAAIVEDHGVLWRIPTDERVVYLTFDQGYEAGYTSRILDILRDKDVPAAFFLTGAYVRDAPALVRRIAEEGHLVGNHTQTHPSLPEMASDHDAVAEEYRAVERAYRELTGRSMALLERPPRGEYSERTLCMVSGLGYTSVMWSFAHRDWLVDDQPPVDVTFDRIVKGTHPGAILLLHSVSESNTRALSGVIDELRARGYRFGSLEEVR